MPYKINGDRGRDNAVPFHDSPACPEKPDQTWENHSRGCRKPRGFLTPTTPPVDVFGALPSSPEAGGDWDWTEKGLGGKLLNFLSRKRL